MTPQWLTDTMSQYGFVMSEVMYDVLSFAPYRLITHPNKNGYIKYSPELAQDLSACYNIDAEAEHKFLLLEQFRLVFGDYESLLDFKPIQKLDRFSFV